MNNDEEKVNDLNQNNLNDNDFRAVVQQGNTDERIDANTRWRQGLLARDATDHQILMILLKEEFSVVCFDDWTPAYAEARLENGIKDKGDKRVLYSHKGNKWSDISETVDIDISERVYNTRVTIHDTPRTIRHTIIELCGITGKPLVHMIRGDWESDIKDLEELKRPLIIESAISKRRVTAAMDRITKLRPIPITNDHRSVIAQLNIARNVIAAQRDEINRLREALKNANN